MPIIDSNLKVIIQDSKPERVCQWIDCPDAEIGYDGRKMKMCARCNVVRYCSKSCQRSDWSEHKLYCQIPPIMDIGAWMETHKSLFRWGLIEALRLRSEPSNILRYGILVKITRMDRLMKGITPSPFLVESLHISPLEKLGALMGAGDIFSGISTKIVDAGGIGEGLVFFLVASPGDSTTVVRCQYHEFHEKPLGQDSPSGTRWGNVVKAIINGDIPISTLSRRIEGPSDVSSEPRE
ncbi:hypothetical protein C8R45DRAFT_989899 [Mycena sanguinolenta]|nr:hypothetical protein C8R45DRAFT_989899 [Mycena sanguinolenta]